MDKIAILDACFPINKQAGVGLAGEWLKWFCANKFEIVDILEAKYILITCVATEQYKYIKSIKTKYPGKIIISGGAASTSPYTIGVYSDFVCVGDGQKFLKTWSDLGFNEAVKNENIWVHNEKKEVEIDHSFIWGCPPIQAEDGAYRFWLGRGCKNKCFFCQTIWANKYSENPNPEKLIKEIISFKKKFAYLSNDTGQHSFFDKLPSIGHGSFTFRYIKKYGLPKARQIRLGVEGVSERLRTLVNKPIQTSELIKCTSWLNANKKSVRWFMIAGLPTEKKEDWEELKESILMWKRITQKGVLALSFTAWCPDPATPFAIFPIDDSYYEHWIDFKEWFFGGKGWSNRIKIMQPQNPKSRILKVMYSMGLDENILRVGGEWGPNDRLKYPFKNKAKKIGVKFYEKHIKSG